MSRKYILLTGLVFSLLLSACTPAPVEEAVEAPVVEEPAEEVVEEEPVAEEEPAEEEPMAEFDMTPAMADFLANMEGYNFTNPAAVNEMLIEGDIFLIDVRETSELEENGYIEGAINLPIGMLLDDPSVLPAFDTPVVVYCGSGWRAVLGATQMGLLGYTDIKSMVGGSYGGWVEAGFPTVEGTGAEPEVLDAIEYDEALLAQLQESLHNLPQGWGLLEAAALNEELVEGAAPIIIDVRKPGELASEGYIEGSVHIQLEEMVNMMDAWPEDKDADIVVYCKVGDRGNIAATILRAAGYTNVRNVKGGFTAWVKAGLPYEGGAADLVTPTAAYLANMESYNTITPAAVNERLIEEDLFLIDVREASELEENGYIEGAINLPIGTLLDNPAVLPAFDTPLVVYCGSGWRAVIGTTLLGQLGYTDVKAMMGGSYGGWVEAGFPTVEGTGAELVELNAIEPDAKVLAELQAAANNLPQGWGLLESVALNEELIDGATPVIIDVRKPEELAENGWIEGSTNIQLEEMLNLMDMWPAEKDADIVVYCAVGTRGNIAATILRSFGYTNVRNVKGGFGAWAEAGLPVVTE